MCVQLVAPESDVGPFRLSGAPILSYGIVPAEDGPGTEFRLSSKRSMATIITQLEDLMSRACIGMMTNATLLEQIKVSRAAFCWIIIPLTPCEVTHRISA